MLQRSFIDKFRQWIFRLVFIIVVFFWKLRAKYGTVSIVKDNILYPRVKPKSSDYPKLTENFGNEILKRLSHMLYTYGDTECLINGYFALTGKTLSCGNKTKTLSDIIRDSKRCGAAFWKLGLRKGDVVHFVIPNNTEYHR